MPYRIKARNSAGNTVTRWDMGSDRVIRDREEAQKIADEFASTRGHAGPWVGIIEYYADEDSWAKPKQSQPRAKLKPGNVWVDTP